MTEPVVVSYVANEGTKWHLIAELGPWMGGFMKDL